MAVQGRDQQTDMQRQRGGWLALMAVLIVGLTARLTRLGHEIWPDEAFNWYVSNGGITRAVNLIQNDFFPPLYNTLLASWLMVFPADAFFLRAPTIVAGMVSLWAAYRLLGGIGGTTTALVAGLLVAVTPEQALWSQVARPFALETMFIVLATLAAYRLVAKGWQEAQSRAALTLLAIGLGGAVYTNNGAPFFTFVSFIVIIAVRWRQTGKLVCRENTELVLVYAAVFALWLLQLPQILAQLEQADTLAIGWHTPELPDVLAQLADYAGVAYLWRLGPLAQALVIGLAGVGFWSLWLQNRTAFWLLAGLTFGYTAFMLALFLLADPVIGRALQRATWLNLMFAMVAGVGLTRFWHMFASTSKWPVLRVCALAVLLLTTALHVRALYGLQQSSQPRWQAAASELDGKVATEDWAAAIPALAYTSVLYYLPNAFSEDRVVTHRYPPPWEADGLDAYLAVLRADYGGRARRIWLFMGDEVEPAELESARNAAQDVVRIDGGALTVMLFDWREQENAQ